MPNEFAQCLEINLTKFEKFQMTLHKYLEQNFTELSEFNKSAEWIFWIFGNPRESFPEFKEVWNELNSEKSVNQIWSIFGINSENGFDLKIKVPD